MTTDTEKPAKGEYEMTDSKHTPGPWRYERAINRDGSHTRDGEHWISSAAGWIDIAITVEDYRAEVQAANARLIAAAPDLLDALEWAVSKLNCDPFEWVDEDDMTAHEAARAAIANAKGV